MAERPAARGPRLRGFLPGGSRLWIDPETYLPIREVQQVVPGTPLGFAMPGDYDPITTDFSWLPPTQANIAKVSLPVPPGFHRTGNRKG